MVQTLALVSALLATLSTPLTISPVLGGKDASEDEADSPVVQAHVILIATSAIFSIGLVFICAYMLAEIDLCTSDEDIRDFVTTFDKM